MIEFPFDSTRAVAVMSGTLERWPNVRIIVPHAGGTLPFLARRIAGMVSLIGSAKEPGPSGSFIAALQRLFYDTAGSSGDNAIGSLLTLVDSSRILYGSDSIHTRNSGRSNDRGIEFDPSLKRRRPT